MQPCCGTAIVSGDLSLYPRKAVSITAIGLNGITVPLF
jgi:hypothetical protein